MAAKGWCSKTTDSHVSAEAKLIPARGKALVNTQISIAVPVGTYGRVAPRSGLGSSAYVSQLINA
jgi:dUTPase